ncbi:hypothetical protein [Sunxiuqinia indica]|uniref:hypothetical protein n=1 Tax=Sunxiuqinia indica TaxID=2692584 RepID=UPI001358CA54|nr:hypothetical protein [Sunxiuqinia indica]
MEITEIAALVAPVLGSIPIVTKWINDRSNEAANRRSLQKAKAQIEFWQMWLKAQREVSTDERFNRLKDDVARHFDELVVEKEEFGTKKSAADGDEMHHSFLQRMLLAYFPHTGLGWILHTLFYISLSFVGMMLLGSAIPENKPNDPMSWDVFVTQLDFVIPLLLVFAVFAFILVRLANRAEKRYQKKIAAANSEKQQEPS